MTQLPINTLLVSQDDRAARAIQELLVDSQKRSFYFKHARTMEAGLASLVEGRCDLCLLDLTPIVQIEPAQDAAVLPAPPSADVFNGRLLENEPLEVLDKSPLDPPPSLRWQAAYELALDFYKAAHAPNTNIPVILLLDETCHGCESPEVFDALFESPPARLDRSRLTTYLLERTILFANERARLVDEVSRLRDRDTLTGLITPRAIHTLIESELVRCQRYGGNVSVLAVQVDRFDELTAEYGRAVSDQVLRWLALLILENIRSVDRAARYTPTEFLVVLPETQARAAEYVARRLLQRIVLRSFILFPKSGPVIEIPVMIGVGVAESRREYQSAHTLIYNAQKALAETLRYRRKKVILWGEEG